MEVEMQAKKWYVRRAKETKAFTV